ncbi:hypothetical protein FG93_03330 [Bosea sp. LC85]|uniref:hypothetical protein n=1 Tax=Bosea sp. LC85 TaxID=1502851 RepID=UPI0004E2FC1D|nr:hypothetical protein [Bosea sp. LC85]KFC69284.1 hypothetical protein FG93_03330 [Bosea sp. LC85]
MTTDKHTDAPVPYRTAQRPGQSGAQEQRRPGPSPLSQHETGPHAPFEADEHDGAASIKHAAQATPKESGSPKETAPPKDTAKPKKPPI